MSGSKSVQFFSSFVYMYFLLEIQLSRGEGWDPINWFNPTIFCACPNPGLGFPMSYVVVSLFCVQWVKVRGDIGGIIYHHCLSFLFLIGSFSSNYELHKWFFFKFQPIRNNNVIYGYCYGDIKPLSTDFLKFVFNLLDIGPAPRNFLLDPLNFCRTYIYFLCKIVLKPSNVIPLLLF